MATDQYVAHQRLNCIGETSRSTSKRYVKAPWLPTLAEDDTALPFHIFTASNPRIDSDVTT